MRTTTKSILAIMFILTASSNVLADRGGWRHGHHHSHRSSWVAPLVVLSVGAVAVSAMANQYEAPPPVVYVPPQRSYPPAPPANVSYFCRSVGQYYPNTQFCPEGWQLVR